MQSLADLARVVSAEREHDAKMHRIVSAATAMVQGCDDAALSMIADDGRVETPSATSDRPRTGDLWQYEMGEGPCLDAIRTQPVVHSVDLAVERERWPR